MTQGLVRYQTLGHIHFVTFSCYRRLPHLQTPAAKHLFEDALERTRIRYGLHVYGYVVMPEHVHLLLSEPDPNTGLLADAIKALKLSVTLRRPERPFWQARYYDFNVFTEDKRTEKLRYIYRNPVTRGLVESPEDYPWSSFRHYDTGEHGTVEIESSATARLREQKSGPVARSCSYPSPPVRPDSYRSGFAKIAPENSAASSATTTTPPR